MAGHDPGERRLFGDLNEKNRLAGEFRRLSGRVRRWQHGMARRRGKRWQAQYGRSISRANDRLAELRGELLTRARDLKQRMEKEQSISKSQVQGYEKQYKKEVAELKKAQEELAKANEALAEAQAKASAEAGETQKSAAVLAELRRKRWNAAQNAERETQEVKKAKKEIASEHSDRDVLAYELRRAIAEIESLS